MKLSAFLAALLLPLLASAYNWQEVRNLDIQVSLLPKGSIVIYEKWDINTGDDITEWYLVRENLGDIEVGGLQVMDETGTEFTFDEEWDIHRTLEQKARHCGIVHKKDGVELCWGVGSHGDHVFHAFYYMTNAIKTLNDYDMLHMQLVSPGLSSPPRHVKVTIECDDVQLDTLNTRMWAFGFVGTTAFEDGKVVFESTEPFSEDDSVIALLRLEKGVFHSQSVQDRYFIEAYQQAMEDASFLDDEKEEDDPLADGLASFCTLLVLYFAFLRPLIRLFRGKKSKKDIKKVLGIRNPDKAEWFRDIPLDGDLVAANCVLDDIGDSRKANSLVLAQILRLVHTGYIVPSREMEGPVKLTLVKDKDPMQLDHTASGLFSILSSAAGEDKVMEEKEFSTWARSHSRTIYDWADKAKTEARSKLRDRGWYQNGKYTDGGRQEARRLLGLKNFLDDFTLVKERETIEARLWKEYLVYAALFGMADKVAKQLKDIDPAFFQENMAYDVSSLPTILSAADVFASSIRKAVVMGTPYTSYSSSSSSSHSYGSGSRGGYGGHSSHRGGGGYSGGGRGGGGR